MIFKLGVLIRNLFNEGCLYSIYNFGYSSQKIKIDRVNYILVVYCYWEIKRDLFYCHRILALIRDRINYQKIRINTFPEADQTNN
ncbi:hypothetical protein BpHYR1_001667 [Brachionus plicatilis]|uniref:Uncharacterized protein n=1 Tax=Brachionus plicatilis TaxID=10195 RepID=A0A3M7P9V0_BRAPC|nr:hypothetical protein BpHYR1_001667 [Brachionus plicatilis]